MDDKLRVVRIITVLALIICGGVYVFTAPYPGNTGWQRTPGVRIGGTETAAPSDFAPLNDVGVAHSARTRLPMDQAVGGPDPLRDWEVVLLDAAPDC